MNYYERLVRRALMRPAAVGEPLHDPFEETGPWELEQAVPVSLPNRPAAIQTTIEVRTHTREVIEQGRASPAMPLPEILPPAEPAREPSVILVPPEVKPSEPPAFEQVGVAASEIPAEVQPPPGEALEAADVFMRSLGVRVPETNRAPNDVPLPDVAPPVEKAVPLIEGPPRSQAQQRLQPPMAPVLEIPVARRVEICVEEPLRFRGVPEPEREARRPAPTVVETRRVVVVEKRSATIEGAVPSGAGAPRFGLGQL